jgi:predicted transcriptional regulator
MNSTKEKVSAAINLRTSLEIIEKLAYDNDYVVRMYIAQHSRIPLSTLYKLLDDENLNVQKAAIANDSVLPEWFDFKFKNKEAQEYANFIFKMRAENLKPIDERDFSKIIYEPNFQKNKML